MMKDKRRLGKGWNNVWSSRADVPVSVLLASITGWFYFFCTHDVRIDKILYAAHNSYDRLNLYIWIISYEVLNTFAYYLQKKF